MNLQDIADRVATEHKLTKTDARLVVESVMTAISEGVKADGEVALASFGKFKVQERAARQGRNPQTGEPIQIPASKKVVFQAAKQFRDAL